MNNLTTANLKRLLDEATPGPWEYLTYDYCPDRWVQDECDQIGAEYPENMTFECGCGDEQETCQTQHYITGKTDGVIAWNPQFNEVPSTDDMHLAAAAPQLAQEVINLRDALGYLVEETLLAAENSDDVVVQKRVADAIKTTVAKIKGDHDE